MNITVNLRSDQSLNSRVKSAPGVCKIYAPCWTSYYLHTIWRNLQGRKLVIRDLCNSSSEVPVSETISLRQLQQMARNERTNVSGSINFNQYGSLGVDCVLSIKDLARHSVIVGLDRTTHYGGYPSAQRIKQSSPVIVCDLGALQFQSRYNTGRHVVIQKHPTECGLFDEEYFQAIVKERKLRYEEIFNFERYKKVKSKIFGPCYFDTLAYTKLAQHDATFSLLAVTTFAESLKINSVVFRFLKYGTGFYAGEFGGILEDYITLGVVNGIECFCKLHKSKVKLLKGIELPFFNEIVSNSTLAQRVSKLFQVYKLPVLVTKLDTKNLSQESLLATTNCGDSHSSFGNEMNFGSVDAAIAENLQSKGNIFSPSRNLGLDECYLNA